MLESTIDVRDEIVIARTWSDTIHTPYSVTLIQAPMIVTMADGRWLWSWLVV
ncbi:MAG: hypothetical protein NVS4B8_28510 [Herpetosiphon sp.]